MTVTTQSPAETRRGYGNNPPTTHMPPPSEGSRAVAVVAVLLIVGGAVLAGWLALRPAPTAPYLAVANTVHYGDRIARTDLHRIDLPDSSGTFVPVSQLSRVVGSYAQVELVPDTVIVAGMYGDVPEIRAGESVVGLNLDPTQFPKTLKPGDHVVLIQTDAQGSPLQVSDGVVRGISPTTTEGASVMDVVMSKSCSDEYAGASSVHRVEVVEVSPNARPVECAAPASLDDALEGAP